MRIFCADEVSAHRVLAEIARLLRKRGLNLQSAKTFVLEADAARTEIEGIAPILRGIQERLSQDILDSLDLDPDRPYLEAFEIDAFLADSPDDIPIGVIYEAFAEHFAEGAQAPFDKTLFHFLLNRLAHARDQYAVARAAEWLVKQPQETNYVLKYVGCVGAADDLAEDVIRFLDSPAGGIYPTQRYWVVRWLAHMYPEPPERIVLLARKLAFDDAELRHTRAIARFILSTAGDASDLEALESAYDVVQDPLEKAQVLCCLGRLDSTRLKTLAGRARRDSKWSAYAAARVTGKSSYAA